MIPTKLSSSTGSALIKASVLSALALACARPAGSEVKVVGGDAHYGVNNPAPVSTVAITDAGMDSICTGTLISKDLVLTASHCFESIASASDIRIYYGKNLFTATPAELHRAKEFKIFNPSGFNQSLFPNYDVAWIRLSEEVPTGHRPVEMLRDANALSAGLPMILSGYGKMTDDCEWGVGDPGCVGRRNEVKLTLTKFYNTSAYHDLLAVDGLPGHGECHGDSGGPTYVDVHGSWYLAGVTNGFDPVLTPDWQQGCASGKGVNTFVGAYVKWVQDSSGEVFTSGAANPVTGTDMMPADIQ